MRYRQQVSELLEQVEMELRNIGNTLSADTSVQTVQSTVMPALHRNLVRIQKVKELNNLEPVSDYEISQ